MQKKFKKTFLKKAPPAEKQSSKSNIALDDYVDKILKYNDGGEDAIKEKLTYEEKLEYQRIKDEASKYIYKGH